MGPPGAGKGTQAAVLSERLDVPHISTGDLFRDHVGGETALGVEVKRYLDSGKLVPDEITNEMVRERLADSDCNAGFLLDGYPRNVRQAQQLGAMLRELNGELDAEIDVVLELDVPEDELVERLLSRGREDDRESVIRDRQQVYRDETSALLEYYSDRLVTVPAVGSVDDVTARALDALRTRT
ncbi:MAG: adenylate kinase [Pseudonocardiaceae bacterium]|nr:adenylate kinase [Pseudonocardiaceae bacterium]